MVYLSRRQESLRYCCGKFNNNSLKDGTQKMKRNQFNNQISAKQEPLPHWMIFLMFLAYVRATQPPPSTALVITLIRALMAILIALILATQGGADVIADVLSRLH
jgi:hypothetical protein